MKHPAFGFAVLAVLLLITSTLPCSAKTVYVKWDSPGPGFDGKSWDTGFHWVYAGLNASVSGDEVWVARGTYVERISLKSGVGLYGGFVGTETARDQRNWNANVTILDGNQHGSVVTSYSGAAGTTRIDGFTIRNGKSEYPGGGGIWCSSSSPTITNNTITGNSATSTGGGIYCSSASSSPVITNNTITGNTAPSGGGIACVTDCTPIITSNVIRQNSRGAVYCEHSGALTIVGNVITGNSTPWGAIFCSHSSAMTIASNMISGNGGSAIRCLYTSPAITNNTIFESSSAGISCDNSSPTVSNNIVAFNALGIAGYNGSAPVLRNNCVYGNHEGNYTDVLPGAGDISLDPLLADIKYGDGHIQQRSPCFGRGWNSAPGLPSTDIDGQPRVQGASVDIGADEWDGTTRPPWPYAIVRVSPSGSDASDGSSWALAKKTVQAGIDAASALGGEVWVAVGTYNERIILRPYSYLYGGFAGTEDSRSERTSAGQRTILDGGGEGTVVSAEIGHRVSAIDGFTIRNGRVSQGNGAGVYCDNSSPVITNNTVTGNNTGILCSHSSPTLTNNTITHNSWYGGIYSGPYCSPDVSNNIIAFNAAGIYGAAGTDGSPTFRNNCVYGNPGRNYILASPGVGDISVDPLLADMKYGDGHVQLGSPCINAGWNDAPGLPSTDMDGQPRVQGGTADIGADESDGTVPPPMPYSVVRVSPFGDDADDGSTWLLAKRTVQAGIGAASAVGGEVWVQAGTYDERILLRVFVYVYGGFAGTENSISERSWTANEAIIDGGAGGSVVTSSVAHQASAIDGFTIRNGSATEGGGVYCSYSSPNIANNTITGNSGSSGGGGIHCFYAFSTITNNRITGNLGDGIFGTYSSPTITDNTISANSGSGIGFTFLSSPVIAHNTIIGNGNSGVYCRKYPTATIADNTITDNRAGTARGGGISCEESSGGDITGNKITGNSGLFGGGICCSASYPAINNNEIADNRAAANGGGIFCTTNSSGTITHNTITGNSALSGAGIYCDRAWPRIINNVIARNTASSVGGGMFCSSQYWFAVTSNTIAENSASSDGGGMFFEESVPEVANNIVAFNSSGIYSHGSAKPILQRGCVYGNSTYNFSGISAPSDNILLDPLFIDRASGDYHLKGDSPCVNGGWNPAHYLAAYDIDGEQRIMDLIVDVGADEYAFGTGLSNTKPARDTAPVWLDGYIVTAVFEGCFYIEAEDRSCGMRVERAAHGVKAGDKVNVTGILKTNADGERYIEAASVEVTGTGSIRPVFINSRALGGSDWLFNPSTGAGQRGVVDGLGLNNIGLLVTTWGKLSYLGGGYALDKTAKILAEGMSLGGDTYVRITGISSCYRDTDGLHPTIRVTEITPL